MTERLRMERPLVPRDPADAPAPVAIDLEPSTDTPVRSRRKVGAVLRDLDPRAITAGRSILPLIVLALFALVSQWDDYALGVLLPDMRADFAFDLQFLLTLQALLRTMSLFAAPVMGYLADRVPRVWMLRLGGLLANGASISVGLARSIPHLVLGRTALGLGVSVQEPAGLPLLADYYPSKVRGRVIAFLGVAGMVGGILGPVIGGQLGYAFGWRTAVVSLGVLATVVSLLSFLLREPVRGVQDRLEMGATQEEAERPQPPVTWAESWRAARRITTVRRLWYSAPFLELAGTPVLVILGLFYAEEFGLDARARGIIMAVNLAVGGLGLVFAGPLADRLIAFRPGRVMTAMGFALVAQTLSLVVVALSPSLPLSIAAGLPLAFTAALFAPAFFTLLSLTVPARFRGLGIQTIAPWRLIGLMLLPFFGSFADTVGLRGSLLLFAPCYAIAAVIVGTAAAGVDRDIRAAKATSLAEQDVAGRRAAGDSPMLLLRDVDVHYDGVQVLFGVDLDVSDGEILALLGTNGAGKSTLLRAIAGITQASGGAVFFDGHDITHLPPHRIAAGGVALVPGGRAVFPGLTVRENLDAVVLADGAMNRVEEALVFFPALRARLDQPAANLSGGEQQMLALAQAFLARPRLLLIDELSLGLAPAVIEQLLDILRAIHQTGTTIVLVEQSVNVALTIAERAVFMEKGTVRFDGPTAELLGRPDVMRAVFLGQAAGRGVGAAPRRTRADADAAPVLVAEDLTVSFGGVRALTNVSLEAAPGEIVGIIGPNGAGKTTLFDALTGTVPLEGGRVLLEGTPVESLAPDARARLGLGRSFQTARLFPTLTSREAIAVAMESQGGSESAMLSAVWAPRVRAVERRIARRVSELIEVLGLQPYADHFVGELSTATRRIVDIACVMASSPRVLLLDEPSSGLSQSETEALGPLLTRLVRETGCALLIVEHDIPLITQISDRLVAMHLGEAIAAGPPAEIVHHPEVVRSYLGTSDDVIARSGARPTR